MKSALLVALGGAIGSLLRYTIAIFMKNLYSGLFPWHTFIVNLAGCFFIGLFLSWSLQQASYDNIRLFIVVGILGGFTTFSSFGLETFDLFRQHQSFLAVTYILSSNLLGIVLVYCGYLSYKLAI